MSNEGNAYEDSVEEFLSRHREPSIEQSVRFAEAHFESSQSQVCFINKLYHTRYVDPKEVGLALRAAARVKADKASLTAYCVVIKSQLKSRGVSLV